ncbi:16S rRNA (adenine(1518)-N(6)/adenine(1519)-N(6))-dimethyltransferase RsmA [Aggregatilineales bacterium SYSU G02658]
MNPKQLMEHYGLDPKKSLGQNFMHDPNTLAKIVATAEVQPDETVLEIGPGTGELTAALAQVARSVIAVELDDRLIPLLESRFRSTPNVYFQFEDILRVNVPALVGGKPYCVVANVPYYITSSIIRHVLEPQHRPRRVVMTMQYEVAQRITAKPGDLSLLAVSVQYYGKPTLISKLNRAVFWPRPDVDSAILQIDPHRTPVVAVPSDEAFFAVVRAGFSQKRKQLRNSLATGLALKPEQADAVLLAANLDPQRRAETLTLAEWGALTRAAASAGVVAQG